MSATKREDGFEQLVDGSPVMINSNEVFKFKCCDCGLVHSVVIGTEENQEIAFVVERENHRKIAYVGENEIPAPVDVYEFNHKTKLLTLLHPDDSKTTIDTTRDAVIIKEGDAVIDRFGGK